MVIETKENLPLDRSISPEILSDTEKSLSNVEKETRINFFKKAWNRIKNIFSSKEEQWQTKFLNNELPKKQENVSPTSEHVIDTKNREIEQQNTNQESQETTKTWSDKISNEMFEQLLKMEGKHKQGNNTLVAKTGKQFWEKFPTWPFGMVYKHIDNEWNLLKKAVPFKEWEKVTEDWWRKNAKAYYDKRAKEWKDILDSKWYKYTQCMLDSLVCQSWWTKKSTNSLKEYVTSHWNNKDGIFNFISKHATTAAWNWKVMPGLVKRAKFAANRFIWNKKPFKEYKA